MAVINRYQGNSGRLTHYPEPERSRRPAPQKPTPSAPQRPAAHTPQHPAAHTPQRPQKAPSNKGQSLLGGLGDLGRVLPERIGELETEDIILLLILYLMYRESGDSDLLIIMGAMFLL
ncbi:MAG: hypothetical protein ACI4O0_01785 [Candidatus Limivicinus sp.]